MPDYKNYTAEDYLADESFVNYLLLRNEADVALWKNRQEAGQVNQEAFTQATSLFFILREQHNAVPVNKEEEWAKLQQLVRAITNRRGQPFLRYLWPAAAAVLIIAAATWFFFPASSGSHTPVKDFVAFAATQTNISHVILPDGSEVILNGNSSISLAPGFNKSKREVLLNGTAFFQVAKNPDKPFTVISGEVNTTALGTSFYIHQSSTAAPTTVSLLTGKVRVDVKGRSSVRLVPYEKAIYQQEKQLVKSTFDNDALVNWTRGMIIFRKANWEQVKSIIEEYFDKELVIPGNTKDISFTGEFKADQLESILSSLKFTYDLKYTIQNQTVNIAF
jgi:ferric-dicitrate binding protein FerR (iron transport regulator)